MWSQANAINESGVVVGFDQIPSFIKAYTWSEATGKVFLGADQGGEGYANGINDVGEVVGSLKYYTDPSGTDLIATLWRSATDWIRLGDFTGGAEQSEALDINNAGQIVGWGTAEAGKEAFYWDELSGLVSLASLVDESLKGWKLLQANTINNLGWIGGQGINPQGGVEGFILIPKQAIPEPGTLTLLGLGLAGIGTSFRRKKANPL
jgi:probable HAF family extracellular repeat protein